MIFRSLSHLSSRWSWYLNCEKQSALQPHFPLIRLAKAFGSSLGPHMLPADLTMRPLAGRLRRLGWCCLGLGAVTSFSGSSSLNVAMAVNGAVILRWVRGIMNADDMTMHHFSMLVLYDSTTFQKLLLLFSLVSIWHMLDFKCCRSKQTSFNWDEPVSKSSRAQLALISFIQVPQFDWETPPCTGLCSRSAVAHSARAESWWCVGATRVQINHQNLKTRAMLILECINYQHYQLYSVLQKGAAMAVSTHHHDVTW